MKNFNLDRFNLEKLKLGESEIILNKTDYPNLKIADGYLVDFKGKRIGTKGDMYHKVILDKILQYGCLDHNPRPKYIDFYEGAQYLPRYHILKTKTGRKIELSKNDIAKPKNNGVELMTPAHTLSINEGVECTYDLSKGESPMITLRPIAYKTSIAEILWIYQLESNDLVLFDELIGKNTWNINHQINNWWEEWALKDNKGNYILNEKGHPTIGSCYGETIRRRHILQNEVINQIRNNPDGRRNIASMWQIDDFNEKHGLKPCAFQTIWNVRHEWDGKDYLDMTLIQRSSDFCTAGCINQVQYAALQIMVARELNLNPGFFTWKPINVQIYDRHIENAIELLNRTPVNGNCTIKLNDKVKNFKDVTKEDITIEDYPKELIKKQNPQLQFELGI